MSEKNVIDCIIGFSRGFFTFITFLLFAGISQVVLYLCEFYVPEQISLSINTFIYLSFSVLLLFGYYNINRAFAFLNKHHIDSLEGKSSTKKTITLFKTPLFWIEYLTKTIFLFTLSLETCFSSFLSFFKHIHIDTSSNAFQIIFKTLIILLFFFIEILVFLIPRKQQAKLRIKLFFKKLLYAMRYIIMYPITCVLVLIIINAFVNLMSVKDDRNTLFKLVFIASLIMLCINGIHYIRAFFVRKKFYKRLKKICQEKQAELSPFYRPYLSILRLGNNQTFTLKHNEKTYSCQMICIKRKGDSVYISENGELEVMHTMFLGKFGPLSKILKENLSYVTSLNFGWDVDDTKIKKILIIAPVSAKMFAGTVERNTPIYVGEKIGKYTVYNGTGFINAIDRNCIR